MSDWEAQYNERTRMYDEEVRHCGELEAQNAELKLRLGEVLDIGDAMAKELDDGHAPHSRHPLYTAWCAAGTEPTP